MKTTVDSFFTKVIDALGRSQRHGTLQLYRSVRGMLRKYPPYQGLTFDDLTKEWLDVLGGDMALASKAANTQASYFRVLRAVYNRACAARKAPYRPSLFSGVYTGSRRDCKRALSRDQLDLLFHSPVEDPVLERTRDFALLMFLLHGMPFVDLVYLRKSDFSDGRIVYYRRKTRSRVEVLLCAEALELLERLADADPSSPYMFGFLTQPAGTAAAYAEYRRNLRTFNGRLSRLAKAIGLDAKLSTYTLRHSWGTLAYHMEVHPGIISQALGHSSILVTETYLKPFVPERITQVNIQLYNAVKGSLPKSYCKSEDKTV